MFEAMLDMQGTYQYWGARIFSYFRAPSNNGYVFQMQVDSAARLWVDNTLLINATCMPLTQIKLWVICAPSLHLLRDHASKHMTYTLS